MDDSSCDSVEYVDGVEHQVTDLYAERYADELQMEVDELEREEEEDSDFVVDDEDEEDPYEYDSEYTTDDEEDASEEDDE